MSRVSRRNALIHVSDAGSFFIGVSLCSFAVVVPSYVKSYTGDAFLLALLPVIVDLGVSLPQTLSVYFFKHFRNRGRQHRNTIGDYLALEFTHRITFILIGISIFVFSYNPGAALASFYIFFIISNVVWGFVIPNWVDLLTVTIPDKGRTSFMAVREFAGRSIGIIASLTLPFILAIDSFPRNYGWLFLISGFFFTAGIIPTKFFKPIAHLKVDTAPHPKNFGAFLTGGITALFSNRALVSILVLFWSMGISRVTYAYYTPYVIDNVISRHPAEMHHTLISGLNISLLIFIAVNSLFMGKIINIFGYRRSLAGGALSLILCNLCVLLTHSYAAAIIGQFFLSLFMLSAYFVSLNAQMDFTSPEERSTISSLNNTINAIGILIFSATGSVLARIGGYSTALTAATAFAFLILAAAIIRKLDRKRTRTFS